LGHLLYFSSFYLSPFLIVVSTSLKILYSFLYREYFNHIHHSNFLLYPTSLAYMWPPLAWLVFHSIAVFVSGLYSNMNENMQLLAFCTWLTSLKMMFSSSFHLPANDKISLLFVLPLFLRVEKVKAVWTQSSSWQTWNTEIKHRLVIMFNNKKHKLEMCAASDKEWSRIFENNSITFRNKNLNNRN
jgi:hypothetical protein